MAKAKKAATGDPIWIVSDRDMSCRNGNEGTKKTVDRGGNTRVVPAGSPKFREAGVPFQWFGPEDELPKYCSPCERPPSVESAQPRSAREGRNTDVITQPSAGQRRREAQRPVVPETPSEAEQVGDTAAAQEQAAAEA